MKYEDFVKLEPLERIEFLTEASYIRVNYGNKGLYSIRLLYVWIFLSILLSILAILSYVYFDTDLLNILYQVGKVFYAALFILAIVDIYNIIVFIQIRRRLENRFKKNG